MPCLVFALPGCEVPSTTGYSLQVLPVKIRTDLAQNQAEDARHHAHQPGPHAFRRLAAQIQAVELRSERSEDIFDVGSRGSLCREFEKSLEHPENAEADVLRDLRISAKAGNEGVDVRPRGRVILQGMDGVKRCSHDVNLEARATCAQHQRSGSKCGSVTQLKSERRNTDNRGIGIIDIRFYRHGRISCSPGGDGLSL